MVSSLMDGGLMIPLCLETTENATRLPKDAQREKESRKSAKIDGNIRLRP
jgi:hypothetical protein